MSWMLMLTSFFSQFLLLVLYIFLLLYCTSFNFVSSLWYHSTFLFSVKCSNVMVIMYPDLKECKSEYPLSLPLPFNSFLRSVRLQGGVRERIIFVTTQNEKILNNCISTIYVYCSSPTDGEPQSQLMTK